jgi:hypothetical protein
MALMKSRRQIASPKAQEYADDGQQWRDYRRDLLPAKWGSTVNLRRKNPRSPMSQLGQYLPKSDYCEFRTTSRLLHHSKRHTTIRLSRRHVQIA